MKVFFVLFGLAAAGAAEAPVMTVGMAGRLEGLVLPGPELEAAPFVDRRTPIVVRILAIYPHGTAFRYDLEYVGLAPGSYNLTDFLRRKDGTPTDDLPEVPVTIVSVLPAEQIVPNAIAWSEPPRLRGYRLVTWLVAGLWLGVFGLILFWRHRQPDAAEIAREPKLLADALKSTIETVLAGETGPDRLAQLEQLLVLYWCRRLRVERYSPAEAMAILKRDERAGAALARLEASLHRPGGAAADLADLLEPYRHLSEESSDQAAEPAR